MNEAYKTFQPIKNIFGVKYLKYLFIIISLFSGVALILLENRWEYLGIISLPICFLLVSCLFHYRRHIWGVGGLIVFTLYCLRYTIFPVIIVLGNYRCDIAVDIYQPYFNSACLLMDIELICVFIFISILSSHTIRKSRYLYNCKRREERAGYSHIFIPRILLICIAVMLLYNIIMYLIYPELFGLYWRIVFFESNEAERLTNLNILINKVPGFFYYLFKRTAELLRFLLILVPVVVINNHKKINTVAKWTLTFILAAIAFSLISNEQLNSWMLCFVICFYMVIKYIKISKILVLIGLSAVGLGFVFVMLFIANVKDLEGFARIINNYFNGPINIANAMHFKDHAELGFANLIQDFCSQIPLLERLTNSISINVMYNKNYSFGGAILPTTGYGYIYFGYFGVALPAIMMCASVIFFDRLTEQSESEAYKVVFMILATHFGLAVGMYNPIIYYSLWVYEGFVPCLTYFLDRKLQKFYYN